MEKVAGHKDTEEKSHYAKPWKREYANMLQERQVEKHTDRAEWQVSEFGELAEDLIK